MTLALKLPFLAIGVLLKAIALACSFRIGRRAVALVLLAALVYAGYVLGLRDSSLVAVREVKVVGIDAGVRDRERIENALAQVARGMTTLHVRPGELAEAATAFATVKSVRAEPHFPNGMTVRVIEHEPIALALVGGHPLAIAADGTVLEGMRTRGLAVPQLAIDRPPARGKLTGGGFEQALVLGAAPPALRSHLLSSFIGPAGVTVRLRGGGEVRFGEAARIEAKWEAASRVLSDPQRGNYAYVDVRIPERPALGGTLALSAVQTPPIGPQSASAPADPPSSEPESQTLNQESSVAEPSTPGGETSVAGGVNPG